MGAIFKIPESNVLRFVQTDTYMTEPQTMYNRLLRDEKWQPDDQIIIYDQKFYPSDPILIQFTTNYPKSSVTCKMYDNTDTEVVVTLDLVVAYTYTDGSGLVTYNVLCDTTGLASGIYYFKLITTTPALEFTSETIELGAFNEYPYLKWRLSDRDGIYYTASTIFGFRIEGKLSYKPASEKSVYEGFNFQDEPEVSVSKRQVEFTTIQVPRYVAEKLELAFAHFEIFINGIQFTCNESAKLNPIDNTNFYDFSITLQEKSYEDYTILQEISGEVVTFNDLLDYDGSQLLDYDNSVLQGVN